MSESRISTYTIPKALEKKILSVIELKHQLEDQEQAIKSELMDVMEEHNLYSIHSERYTVTRATRSNYKAIDINKVNKDYIKKSLDTAKVANFEKLYGRTPAQIQKTESSYITWRERRGTSE